MAQVRLLLIRPLHSMSFSWFSRAHKYACACAGKSNLMDAVSFVMGANTKDLRGQKVTDFRSHGAGKDDDNTSVTLFYRPASQR